MTTVFGSGEKKRREASGEMWLTFGWFMCIKLKKGNKSLLTKLAWYFPMARNLTRL